MTAAELLADVDASLPGRVAAYRGGYLPEERRALEEALRSGELIGLAATNALELGIDISGLDAVLMAGFPGTRAALWQQVGRAGRGARDALAILVARDDPLDTYLVTHPEALLGRPVEATVFDPANPYVLGPQLCAAAQELPLTEADLALFGPTAREVVDALTEGGLLRRRPRGWFWTDRRRASDLADIRSTGGVAGAAGRGRDRTGDRHRRRVELARHGPRRRGLRPPRRDLAGAVPRPRGARGGDRPRRARLLHDRPRAHRHLDRRGARARALGLVPAVLRDRRRDPPGGRVPASPPARRRGARRGAARPAGALAAHGRGLVDGARARPGRVRARRSATCPEPRTRPSTARSGCCRSSRPATAGTSVASRPRCIPTPGS